MIVVYVTLGTLIVLMTMTFIYLFMYEKNKNESVIEHVKAFSEYNSDGALFHAAVKKLDNTGNETYDEKISDKAKEIDVLASFKNLNDNFIKKQNSRV